MDTPHPPPYTRAYSQFGDLDGETEKRNVAEVSYHLRKAKVGLYEEVWVEQNEETIKADFL